MKPYLKGDIDFDEIKRQRKDIDISVKVNREIIIPRYPKDREGIEKAIVKLQAKISELDAILAKEPPPECRWIISIYLPSIIP
ncbi:hypothetical protein [Photorhabdus hainanensis]|uniref:hypothetical protein n=1 Tax=Photorhabdus hainanensis TaxID=1004166 RepID=UPI001BD39B9C|nr:hypothetical protein [Photorhabdus hainanensis]